MEELEIKILDFWNKNHLNEDISVLSGVKYDETIDFLKIRKFLKKGCKVLEIGVGLGYVTEQLFKNGMIVSAVDLSNIALNKVKKYCENVYNINELSELPSNYFDIIICNNVVQHVPTNLLIDELKQFIRSLKTEGVFAIEFVSSDLSNDTGISPEINDIQAGRLCRTPIYLESIFNNFNSKCLLVFDNKINIGILRGQHVFHVTK